MGRTGLPPSVITRSSAWWWNYHCALGPLFDGHGHGQASVISTQAVVSSSSDRDLETVVRLQWKWKSCLLWESSGTRVVLAPTRPDLRVAMLLALWHKLVFFFIFYLFNYLSCFYLVLKVFNLGLYNPWLITIVTFIFFIQWYLIFNISFF